MFSVPEKYRVVTGAGSFNSDSSFGNNGMFEVPLVAANKSKRTFTVIASDEMGWEHVSVSLPDRCPTWDEMSAIKRLFWGDEDAVIQIHPPRDQHKNLHQYCLHLWRKAGTNHFFEAPPSWMVSL